MYQTLYRKYRPKKFDDVIGQKVAVKTLKNSIKNDKINHAYMFFGPRGVGKTSIAKIFAKSINCEKHDGDICNECDYCKVTTNKECLDIIEIDAASNNGVDEIRELIDKVSLVPNQLKYKVYIIDEVHMLTIQAFNALLKTLEEPPSHVIFILATTDPQKVPETIVSRCQCFSFERISERNIVSNLNKICLKEKIEIDEDVLNRIAILSNGGMRDAIGMLDKLCAYCDGKITIEDFIEINKIVNDTELEKLLHEIELKNVKSVIDTIDNWNNDGVNIIQLGEYFITYLKKIIILSIEKNGNKILSITDLIKLANKINEKMFDLKKSGNPKIYFEILLLDYMNDLGNTEIISREIISNKSEEKKIPVNEELENHKNKKEFTTSEVEKSNDNTINVTNSNINEILEIRLNNIFSQADKNELQNDQKNFKLLMDYTFDQKIGYLVCALLDGKIRASSKEGLVLSYEYDSIVEENLIHLEEFSNVINKILGINKKIVILSDEKWNIEKNNYIQKIKKNETYQYIEEPTLTLVNKKNDIKADNGSLISTFGDIVEIE